KGVFWRELQAELLAGSYKVFCSDIKPKFAYVMPYDYRNLPYKEDTFNVFLLDPSWLPLHGRSRVHHEFYDKYESATMHGYTYDDIIRENYMKPAEEAWRVLAPGGLLIAKCGDLCPWNAKAFLSFDIDDVFRACRFEPEDRFIRVAGSLRLRGP